MEQKNDTVLEDAFSAVYKKFKFRYYQNVFAQAPDRELSLTTIESFCAEIIGALDEPTINEFASFVNISSPNATYRVNSLIQKGYIEKVQSETDKREYHLRMTDKYYKYYNIGQEYVNEVLKRVQSECSKEDIEVFNRILVKMRDELMPEVDLEHTSKA